MKGKLSVRNGVWYCVIYFEDESGKFNQKWVSTGLKERGNKRNAEKFLEAKIQELSYIEPDKVIAKRPVKTPAPPGSGGLSATSARRKILFRQLNGTS